MEPRTTSSSRLRKKWPLLLPLIDSSSFCTLFAYSDEDVVASRDGRSVYPITRTPLGVSTDLPGSVHSQLPPASAPRSTTTDPGFIDSTMALVISLGEIGRA